MVVVGCTPEASEAASWTMVDGTWAMVCDTGTSATLAVGGTSASWAMVKGISAMVDGTSASRAIVSGPSATVDGTGTSASWVMGGSKPRA